MEKALEYPYLWVGCNHHCKGCFNRCAWDFEYGNKFTEEQIDQVINYLDHDYISGLSLLGGEPLEKQNQEGLLPLVKKVKEKFPDKNIWCYTGFDFEKEVVGEMAKENETTKELLKYIDVMVDGKFEEDKKDLSLRFRGSSNQRILDVQESLKEHKPVDFKLDWDNSGQVGFCIIFVEKCKKISTDNK